MGIDDARLERMRKAANVRFRLRDGRAVQLLYSSDITVKPEQRPIYEVLSSHCARKAFSGNMYDKVPDPNLINNYIWAYMLLH